MDNAEPLIEKVEAVYNWLDGKLQNSLLCCEACGKCCDFEDFDHRLYITAPEFIYFKEKLGTKKILPLADGKCPYNDRGKCGVYKYRFAGCRIFHCKGRVNRQSELSEKTIHKFKKLCLQFDLPYTYTDLAAALTAQQP